MARSLDQVNMEKKVKAGQGSEVSGQDTEIAVRMAIKMLNEGEGMKVINDALNKSEDPAMVIGQFLAQLMGAMGEALSAKIGLDPRVFLAKDGFLDKILDYIESQLGYPPEFSDQIYGQVLEVIKAAAQKPPAPNNVMGEGGQPPVPPQAAQPMGGIPNGG